MDRATHHNIASFIWDIADDVVRNLLKRGKYLDVISPMRKADPIRSLYATRLNSDPFLVEYEPDGELRYPEQPPLLEGGVIEAFVDRDEGLSDELLMCGDQV